MSRDDDRSSRSRDRDEPRGRSRDSDRDDPPRRSRDDDAPRGRGREDDTPRRSSRDDDAPRSRSRDDDDRGSRRGGSSRFEYKERDESKTKRRSEQGANDFDRLLKEGVKMFKPSNKDNCIRILPPTWDGAEHYGLDVFVHYGVGPDRGSYLCLDKMLGKPDPIAEEYALARKDGDDEYAKEISPKKRVLVYLIDRNNEKEGVQAWAMPWTVDRDIVKVSVDRQTGEVMKIDHPEYGYDIMFEKKGEGARTEYLGVQVARRESRLGKDEWLDYAMDNPLPSVLNYFDYDHIAKAFGGGSTKGSDRGGSDRDHNDDRGRDRDRDDPPRGRERERDPEPAPSRSKEPELSWDTVHDMTKRELEDLIDQERLDIDPREAKGTEDLADWICDELKLKKAERRKAVDDEPAPARRRAADDEDKDPPASERLSRMRRERD